MSDTDATIVVGLIMLVGLAGTLIPILPGLALIWAAGVLYGLLVGFGPVGWGVMVVLSLALVVSVVKGVLVPRRMAEGKGVSGWSQLVAFIGAVIGFFVIPVIGLVVGALVGLLVAEYLNHGAWAPAWEATVAVAKGFGLSVLIDLALGLAMLSLWAVWAFSVLG